MEGDEYPTLRKRVRSQKNDIGITILFEKQQYNVIKMCADTKKLNIEVCYENEKGGISRYPHAAL